MASQDAVSLEKVQSINFRLAQGFSPLVILLLICLVTVAWKLYASLSETLERNRRILLASLRIAAFILIALLLLQPVADMHVLVTVPSTLAVLMDGSSSMEIMDETGPGSREQLERFSAGWKWLRDTGVLRQLSQRNRIMPFVFSSEPRPLAPGLDLLSADQPLPELPGGGSNPGGAILKVQNQLKNSNLSGIIMVSDGRRTEGPDPSLASRLAGVPVFTLSAGSAQEMPDLWIEDLKGPEKAYIGMETKIQVSVSSRGMALSSVPLVLRAGQEELARSFVNLSTGRAQAQLTFTPREKGILELLVLAPAQPGEKVIRNNSRPLMIQVSEARTRVLLLSSMPNWDYKFLRQTLLEDSTIRLTTLCLLKGRPIRDFGEQKTDSSIQPEESKGPTLNWPLKSASDLAAFEVVILVEPAGFDGSLEPLVEWTREGGGLFLLGGLFPGGAGALLGGATGLGLVGSPGSSPGTSPDPSASASGATGAIGIEALLPLAAVRGRQISRWVQPAGKPSVTPAGADHPFSRLVPGNIANSSVWREWPDLEAVQETLAKTGALCLVRSGDSEKGMPLLAVHRFGRGRVSAMPVRGLWRYRFMMAGAGKDRGRFATFVSSGLGWLRNDRGDSLITLQTHPGICILGQEVAVRASALTEAFEPLEQESLTVTTVFQKEGMGSGSGAADQTISLAHAGRGVYQGKFKPSAAGRYTLSATLPQGASAQARVIVTVPPAEFRQTGRDSQNLLAMATISNGKCMELSQAPELVTAIPDKSSSYETLRQVQLWNTPYLMLLLVALFAIEWIIRRREGLE